MTERHLVAAERFCRIVEHTAAKLGAERAGVILFSYIKNYLRYIGRHNAIFHMNPAAKLFHLGIIRRLASAAEVVKFHIYRYCHQFEFFRIKAA